MSSDISQYALLRGGGTLQLLQPPPPWTRNPENKQEVERDSDQVRLTLNNPGSVAIPKHSSLTHESNGRQRTISSNYAGSTGSFSSNQSCISTDGSSGTGRSSCNESVVGDFDSGISGRHSRHITETINRLTETKLILEGLSHQSRSQKNSLSSKPIVSSNVEYQNALARMNAECILKTSAMILWGDQERLRAVLDVDNFDHNSKSVNQSYEEYVLNHGDVDERLFLGRNAHEQLGTPQKTSLPAQTDDQLSSEMHARQRLIKEGGKSLAPQTPLTGRRYLQDREGCSSPVSTATHAVGGLQTLLAGRRPVPQPDLIDLLTRCGTNLAEDITNRITALSKVFCEHYSQPSESGSQQAGSSAVASSEFAERRCHLAVCLYYKLLEEILDHEQARLKSADPIQALSALLEQELFHKSLFACCLEVILYSYNYHRLFPWVLDVLEISAYHFYKVIEISVRAEESFSRDIVKHLNHVEERILESMAWKSDSPLWEAVLQQGAPTCDEVSLPTQAAAAAAQTPVSDTSALRKALADPTAAPGATPSAAACFMSPTASSARRRLFVTDVRSSPTKQQGMNTTLAQQVNSGVASTAVTSSSPQKLLRVKLVDNKEVLIPFQASGKTITRSGPVTLSPARTSHISSPVRNQRTQRPVKGITLSPARAVVTVQPPSKIDDVTAAVRHDSKENVPQESAAATPQKAKKTGSLALFFRKVYHLAAVRMRDLCERLHISSELTQQIWTCFQHSVTSHTELMTDRHLDQLLMCAVYITCKVTEQVRSFQDVMKCYRLQPQARSHVYRSVLLTERTPLAARTRRTSGSSAGSSPESTVPSEESHVQQGRTTACRSASVLGAASQPPSPSRSSQLDNTDDRADLIKFYNAVYIKRMKTFAIRFSSQSQEKGVAPPPLSPLPSLRGAVVTNSPRRLSVGHNIYLSPSKQPPRSPLAAASPLSSASSRKMVFSIQRSPSKALQTINRVVRQSGVAGVQQPTVAGNKRLLHDELEPNASIKRLCSNPPLYQRLDQM